MGEQVKCTTAKELVDLVLLVDSSGSVRESDLTESKQFLKRVAEGLALGTGSTGTRLGMVQSDHYQYDAGLQGFTIFQAWGTCSSLGCAEVHGIQPMVKFHLTRPLVAELQRKPSPTSL